MNLICIIFAAFHAVRVAAETNQTGAECLDHRECAIGSFCAASSCSDGLGRKYLCGICEPCSECLCHKDAVDGACPINKCPDQPAESIRFLQGPLFARTTISGVPTHVCVRRLLFDTGSFFDVQAAIRVDHPASAASINLTSVNAQCPAFSRAGLLLGLSTSTLQTFVLNVVVTSEGNCCCQCWPVASIFAILGESRISEVYAVGCARR